MYLQAKRRMIKKKESRPQKNRPQAAQNGYTR